ncbi:MAG: hypothetical protein ACP6IQ_06295 [Candidatus Njordarchaeia archaeon]|nr:hypothetical protein [Candidatus Korarchaeota archaeon]
MPSCCGRCGNRRYCDWGKNPPYPIQRGLCVYGIKVAPFRSLEWKRQKIREAVEHFRRTGSSPLSIVNCCRGCQYFVPV